MTEATQDWSRHSQLRLEIESEIRNKISEEIHIYSAFAQGRGLNNYFVSGLEVAADIALLGLNDRHKQGNTQTEVLFE
jgi:hypothetical protein